MTRSNRTNRTNDTSFVIVGLSGGVDSSVAALELLRAGHHVEGLFMFNWGEDEAGRCTAAADYEAAAAVCAVLDIPLHRADFSAEYRQRVFAHFLDEYAAGRTPNPDVACNREIKFNAFLQYARRLGADCIATGHYARIAHGSDGPQLLRGVDPAKDQSYFLSAVPAAALAASRFPLGGLLKKTVREIARDAGLPSYARPDSTGVCFIGERDFAAFLEGYLPARPGAIRVADAGTLWGRRIGEHRGVMFHTLGQRRGLGLGGVRGAPDAPWYVVRKAVNDNTLWVSQDPQHPDLMQRELVTAAPHWIGSPPRLPLHCAAQVRYRQSARPCTIEADGAGLHVTFAQLQRAVTPGQYLVMYDGDHCLGSAVIEHTPGQRQQVANA